MAPDNRTHCLLHIWWCDTQAYRVHKWQARLSAVNIDRTREVGEFGQHMVKLRHTHSYRSQLRESPFSCTQHHMGPWGMCLDKVGALMKSKFKQITLTMTISQLLAIQPQLNRAIIPCRNHGLAPNKSPIYEYEMVYEKKLHTD